MLETERNKIDFSSFVFTQDACIPEVFDGQPCDDDYTCGKENDIFHVHFTQPCNGDLEDIFAFFKSSISLRYAQYNLLQTDVRQDILERLNLKINQDQVDEQTQKILESYRSIISGGHNQQYGSSYAAFQSIFLDLGISLKDEVRFFSGLQDEEGYVFNPNDFYYPDFESNRENLVDLFLSDSHDENLIHDILNFCVYSSNFPNVEIKVPYDSHHDNPETQLNEIEYVVRPLWNQLFIELILGEREEYDPEAHLIYKQEDKSLHEVLDKRLANFKFLQTFEGLEPDLEQYNLNYLLLGRILSFPNSREQNSAYEQFHETCLACRSLNQFIQQVVVVDFEFLESLWSTHSKKEPEEAYQSYLNIAMSYYEQILTSCEEELDRLEAFDEEIINPPISPAGPRFSESSTEFPQFGLRPDLDGSGQKRERPVGGQLAKQHLQKYCGKVSDALAQKAKSADSLLPTSLTRTTAFILALTMLFSALCMSLPVTLPMLAKSLGITLPSFCSSPFFQPVSLGVGLLLMIFASCFLFGSCSSRSKTQKLLTLTQANDAVHTVFIQMQPPAVKIGCISAEDSPLRVDTSFSPPQ